MRNDETDEDRTRDKGESRSRIDESRRLEERTAQIRGSYKMRSIDPLHIPQEMIPPGWTYHWMRESIMGEPDPHRLTQVRMAGWTPVPADRHSFMISEDILGRNNHLRGYIYRMGLILHERPTIFSKEEQEKQNAVSRQAMSSLKSCMDNSGAEFGMPSRVLSNEVEYSTSFEDSRGFA